MKNAIVATALFSLVVVVLLTFFNLTPFPTVKKLKPQEAALLIIQKPDTENQADVAEDMPGTAWKINISPLVEEPSRPFHTTTEPSRPEAEDLILNNKEKSPSLMQTITISRSIDIQPTLGTGNNTIPGLGLLTDTGETAENEILELQSMQVQPTTARRTTEKHRKTSGVHKK